MSAGGLPKGLCVAQNYLKLGPDTQPVAEYLVPLVTSSARWLIKDGNTIKSPWFNRRLEPKGLLNSSSSSSPPPV